MGTATLEPISTNSNAGGWTGVGDAVNLWANIDEGTAGPNDTDYIAQAQGGSANNNIKFGMTPTPGSDATLQVTAVTIVIRMANSVSKSAAFGLKCQIFQSDGATAITASFTINTVSTSFTNYSNAPSITGATDKASWDSALLSFSWPASTGSGTFKLSAVEVDITYTVALPPTCIYYGISPSDQAVTVGSGAGGEKTNLMSYMRRVRDFVTTPGGILVPRLLV